MEPKIRVVESLSELRQTLTDRGSIGFVPTMGALHAGHASIVEKARRENFCAVVSIFVNPTQFNDPKDLEKYPRTQEADLLLLEKAGAHVVWFPRYEDLYADDYRYQIQENEFSNVLCGKSRQGHFTGMLTVVMKLLQAVRPTRAYFGEKDFQQLELVRGMVDAFLVNTQIVGCPIIRDQCGLALSSRNARLSPEGLETARAFACEISQTDRKLDEVRESLQKLPLEIDYLEDHLQRRFAAVIVEGIRLIDNRALSTLLEKEPVPHDSHS